MIIQQVALAVSLTSAILKLISFHDRNDLAIQLLGPTSEGSKIAKRHCLTY